MTNEIENLVIYQDEALLVINKPAGLPTLVDGYYPDAPYLLGLVKKTIQPVWVVHRLDRQTSGVILFALSAQAHRNLNIQFEKRETQKIYHAIVNGIPSWDRKTVNLRLRVNGDRKHRTVVDAMRGKPSSTTLQIIETYLKYSLISAEPHSGRTHQIRAHLAAIQLPIVVDPLYGDGQSLTIPDQTEISNNQYPTNITRLERLGLHAYQICLSHPTTHKPIEFFAPYPEDFSQVLDSLKKSCL